MPNAGPGRPIQDRPAGALGKDVPEKYRARKRTLVDEPVTKLCQIWSSDANKSDANKCMLKFAAACKVFSDN